MQSDNPLEKNHIPKDSQPSSYHKLTPIYWKFRDLLSSSFLDLYPMILLRVVLIILAILAISGALNAWMMMLGWNGVFQAAYSILDDSLKSAAIFTIALTAIKGTLELFSTISVGVIVANVTVGEFLQGPLAVVDFLFRFFIASTGIIIAQISLLKLIELIGITTLCGTGFICLAIQPEAGSFFGRLGRLLLIIGLVLYLVFPAMVASVGKAYETHRIDTEIQNKENIAVLSQRSSEISLRSLATRDSAGRDAARETFSDGISSIWQGFLGVFISYTLMFIFLPLAGLGFCYLIIQQAMLSLNYSSQVDTLESGRRGLMNWVSHGGSKKQKNSPVEKDASTQT